MYTMSLETMDSDYEAAEGPQGLTLLSQHFHHQAITDISIAVRKPTVATCSQDGSVRVWNYEANTLDLVKYFAETPLSVALHPSGLHVLVGFADKLRLLNLLVDDVCTFNDFAVKNCQECAFSHGGHQFAVANGTLVEVYETYSFQNVAQFKGEWLWWTCVKREKRERERERERVCVCVYPCCSLRV
jgi:WD40 repeat protein